MKIINRSLAFIVVSVTFFAISCKKEKHSNPIENAKDWYLIASKSTKTSFTSPQGKNESISQKIHWESAHSVVLSDGSHLIAVPEEIQFANGNSPKGSYLLMIKEEGSTYKSYLAFNEDENRFDVSLTNADVEKAYNDLLMNIAIHQQKLGKSTKDKVMVENAHTVCIDWYLTTIYYDDNGNIAETVEAFLYQQCYEEGPGGGGGGLNPVDEIEPEIEWGEPESTPKSATVISEIGETPDWASEKVVDIEWWIYNSQARNIRFRSLENADVAKPVGLNYWVFKDFKHVSIIPVGIVSQGNVQVNFVSADFHGSTILDKHLKLTYQEIYSFIGSKGKQKTAYSPYMRSTRSWTAEAVSQM